MEKRQSLTEDEKEEKKNRLLKKVNVPKGSIFI